MLNLAVLTTFCEALRRISDQGRSAHCSRASGMSGEGDPKSAGNTLLPGEVASLATSHGGGVGMRLLGSSGRWYLVMIVFQAVKRHILVTDGDCRQVEPTTLRASYGDHGRPKLKLQ